VANFQPIQSEEITLESDMDEYVLNFREKYRTLIIQVYSKDGILKDLKVNSNIILPNGKTVLKCGDVIKYIAII
jgi:hypothetical protein